VLPGGMPGTIHLGEHEGVKGQVLSFFEKGKLVAAICAAPSVLGSLGVLKGKRATCHPGFEEKLLGAEAFTCVPVVRDTNVITSRGMGTALDFALEIVRYFTDEETIFQVRKGLVY
jgi:protein deglycase